jgi:hypothetical protein
MGLCKLADGNGTPAAMMMTRTALPRPLVATLLLLLPLSAAALCTSDDVPEPAAVLERFLSADCLECWRDPATPRAAADTLALDWVLPGRQGADAPLATVALGDALERLHFLRQPPPRRSAALTSGRAGDAVPLRVALGEAVSDYIGTSIELLAPARGPWQAWLLLVESLPAGTEGSPVPRNLVRNVFRPAWDSDPAGGPAARSETRAMQIHAGGRPERLRLVALLQDALGRMRAIRRTECRP